MDIIAHDHPRPPAVESDESQLARGAAVGALAGFVVVTVAVALGGVVSGMEAWSAIGLGLFLGAWGGSGLGFMMGGTTSLARQAAAGPDR